MAVRGYKDKHGSLPAETLGSDGYWLAKRIRFARDKGLFNAKEVREVEEVQMQRPRGGFRRADAVGRGRSGQTPDSGRRVENTGAKVAPAAVETQEAAATRGGAVAAAAVEPHEETKE